MLDIILNKRVNVDNFIKYAPAFNSYDDYLYNLKEDLKTGGLMPISYAMCISGVQLSRKEFDLLRRTLL